MIIPNTYIVQQTYKDEGDLRWYVHEICFMDKGRFTTEQAALEFKAFLDEKYHNTY